MKRDLSYYVYVWYSKFNLFPVYVGHGKGGRATRRESKSYHVVIVQDHMSKFAASAGEKVIYKLLKPLGGLRLNLREPVEYQEYLYNSEKKARQAQVI